VSPTNAILYMVTATACSATNVLAHTADVFGTCGGIGQDANDGVNAATRVYNV